MTQLLLQKGCLAVAEDPGDEIALGTRVGVTQCMLMLARFFFCRHAEYCNADRTT